MLTYIYILKVMTLILLPYFHFCFSLTGIEKWLIPFSMYRNWSQLVASPTSSGDYKILNGIKTVLMTMTIVAHRSMFTAERVALTNWSYFERVKCIYLTKIVT